MSGSEGGWRVGLRLSVEIGGCGLLKAVQHADERRDRLIDRPLSERSLEIDIKKLSDDLD